MKYLLVLGLLLFLSCEKNRTRVTSSPPVYRAEIVELSKEEYPHNPDYLIQDSLSGRFSYEGLTIEEIGSSYSISILPANEHTDTLRLDSVDLLTWIPTVPDRIKSDAYLVEITLVNQEWNRQQTKFFEGQFEISNPLSPIKRVDLARNCLNSYLWEIIAYTHTKDSYKPVYHGWFNFPKDLYQQLFYEANNLEWNEYAPKLEYWSDPESKGVNLDLIRTLKSSKKIAIQSKNDGYYPRLGERFKKEQNIIYPPPSKISSIEDFLNDSTLFATFSPPGFYDRDSPRKTQLSLLRNPSYASLGLIGHEDLVELRIEFESGTQLVLGGIDLSVIPSLSFDEIQDGFQMPMGIANHSFYESYTYSKSNPSIDNPYYGLLLDSQGKFLDSHAVGIDGPLLHFDLEDPNKLHLWILSFERHAFVGHYILSLSSPI